MSLQDDIFDVQAALKGRPERRAFERITERFNRLEVSEANNQAIMKALAGGMRALRYIEEEIE